MQRGLLTVTTAHNADFCNSNNCTRSLAGADRFHHVSGFLEFTVRVTFCRRTLLYECPSLQINNLFILHSKHCTDPETSLIFKITLFREILQKPIKDKPWSNPNALCMYTILYILVKGCYHQVISQVCCFFGCQWCTGVMHKDKNSHKMCIFMIYVWIEVNQIWW